MHYDSKAFSKNGRPTIAAKKQGVSITELHIIQNGGTYWLIFQAPTLHTKGKAKLAESPFRGEAVLGPILS